MKAAETSLRAPRYQCSIEPFITERRHVLAAEFKLSYEILNVRETQAIAATDAGPQLIELDEPIIHSEALLVVSGNCFFDESNNAVSDLRLSEIDCLTLDGHQIIVLGATFLSGGITIGRKQIPHTNRRPRDQT